MNKRSDSKLNQLQLRLPEGFLADAAWLEQQGYSSSLRSQYVSAGWLTQPARRVYQRSRGPLGWEQVVTSLQTLMGYRLQVGGRTALEAQGYSHYLSDGPREVHLYGPDRPPTWLSALPLDVEFRWHNSQRLFPDAPTFPPRTAADDQVRDHGEARLPDGFMMQPSGRMTWPVQYSSVERAVLELLDELPDRESFHQVDMLIEGLATLSPNRLQSLLADCRSVKVKRLFFFFADRHRHAWLAKLDKAAVDLGSGKRVLVRGGRLDPHYLITVPKELAEGRDGVR